MTGCGVWDRDDVRRHPCPAPGRNPEEVIVALHTVEFTMRAAMSNLTKSVYSNVSCRKALFPGNSPVGPTKTSLFNFLS